jgi:DNA-binding NarL/FixJ family response regulator
VNIVLLDITMPGESGLDALKELRQKYPPIPVLILSFHPEHRFAVRALKAGASGYITKQSAPEELVQAIRKIVGGGKYVSAALAEELATELDRGSGKLPHETLSDREFQVMRLIAAGKKSSEIAEELSVTMSTVNTYRMRIFEKMKMQSNVELARYALEHGLIE